MQIIPSRSIRWAIKGNGPIDREQVCALLGLVVAGEERCRGLVVVLEVVEGLALLSLRPK